MPTHRLVPLSGDTAGEVRGLPVRDIEGAIVVKLPADVYADSEWLAVVRDAIRGAFPGREVLMLAHDVDLCAVVPIGRYPEEAPDA